jgi:hypothetical protein
MGSLLKKDLFLFGVSAFRLSKMIFVDASKLVPA